MRPASRSKSYREPPIVKNVTRPRSVTGMSSSISVTVSPATDSPRPALVATVGRAVTGWWDLQDMDKNEQESETVERLGPEMTGRWKVFTRRAAHIWDLNEGTYTRLPGPQSQAFDGDGVAARIYTVRAWPEVGSRFWVYVDDAHDSTMTQWRISSTIRSIELEDRVPDEPVWSGSSVAAPAPAANEQRPRAQAGDVGARW